MNWREMAACRGEDPDLFFPIGNVRSGMGLLQVDEAKAVCHRCPVVRQCLDWALEVHPVDGIWGGTTEEERRAVKRRAVHNLRTRGSEAPRRTRNTTGAAA
ncbi:WhiB family transcriptional regulator [Embleya hyalina]|uniref:Transcriptional regulator WhiB n=1 Tax=Embleya hyalina TaxID=516124 RepID=A0A401YX40_9ACTN|nr:WhiB family transcriptional regulator [Embleya hyalina]GCD99182.1 transcriptional regulator WhiB [Embleya hyalina]